MSYAMFGTPNQLYDVGRKFLADSTGKIADVPDLNDRKALRDSGCLDETPIVAVASSDAIGSVLSVAGRTGNVVLSHTDVSGLGSAALVATTAFDAAGAAATAQAAAEAASDPVGSAAAASAAPLVLTGQISTPGAATGTLTNAPAAGNAQTWLQVTINGVMHWIPAWHA